MVDSAEIAPVLQEFAYASSNGDGPGLARLLSKRAIRVIGSDPEEYWGPDPEDVSKKIVGQVEAMGGQMKFTLNSPDAHEEGDVGWVADQVTVRLPDGTEVPFRFTGCCATRTDGSSSRSTSPWGCPTRRPSARNCRPRTGQSDVRRGTQLRGW